MKILHGPFAQLLSMDKLPRYGALRDADLDILTDAGILVQWDKIVAVGSYKDLEAEADYCEPVHCPTVALPAFIDSHTHLCWAGSRAKDYALRLQGVSYQEIAKRGGGILDTVRQTRAASQETLEAAVIHRCQRLFRRGVRTVEVKSGYGLSVEDELKMLRAIQRAQKQVPVDIIPTCLAAHTCPKEFSDPAAYLKEIQDRLLPRVKKEELSQRVDIFVEEGAFSVEEARGYLEVAKDMGFDLTLHADQFSTGAAPLAAALGAQSADHLEASGPEDLKVLEEGRVVATVLPGASLGLGLPFAPARQALDRGLCVAIASDWNPGSAPMGDLLTQAALLGAAQKLSAAETLAGITVRAAHALNLHDRGVLAPGKAAHIIAFPCSDYREILYHQGCLAPMNVIHAL